MWGIARFVAFRVMFAPAGNGEYHQLRALLANSQSQIHFFLGSAEILFARRASSVRRAPRAAGGAARAPAKRKSDATTLVRVMLPLVLLAVASLSGFYVVSLFGAQLIRADDTARIRSDHCGWAAEVEDIHDVANQDIKDTSAALLVAGRAALQQCRAYARQCYAGRDAEEPDGVCGRLLRPRVESTLSFVPCPFPGGGVCKTDAARIDSGLIDSRAVLGINTPDQATVGVGKITTCSPIHVDQWATEWIHDGDGLESLSPGDRFKGYAVGKMPGVEPPGSDYPISVTSYSISLSSVAYPLVSAASPRTGKAVSSLTRTRWVTYMAGNESASAKYFVPREELSVENADLNLISLSTGLVFDDRVADPWFNITVQMETTFPVVGTTWSAPPGASVLACLEQYEFCAADVCSQPNALYRLRQAGYGLELTSEQRAVADLVWKALWAAQLQYSLLLVGHQLLVANEAVMSSWYMRSLTLPSNQWVLEVQNMANISLAALQRRPGDYASPQLILQADPRHIIPPESSAAQALCGEILIRTTSYTSFKVAGLLLLLLLTVVLAVVNTALPRLWSHPEWLRYGFFHLLRLALEGKGIGPWAGRANTCPALLDRSTEFSLQESSDSDGADDLSLGDSRGTSTSVT